MPTPVRKVTLEEWFSLHYSDNSRPAKSTIYLWIKTNRIHPAPERHGKSWMLDPAAEYCEPLVAKLWRR